MARRRVISTATIEWTGDAEDVNDAIVKSEAALVAWLESAPAGVTVEVDRDCEVEVEHGDRWELDAER